MRKTKLYNNLSEELLKSTLLKRGQQVTYRIAKGTPNSGDKGKIIYPSAENVPPIDQIWDEKKQEYVDIAMVKSVDAEGNHTFHNVFFYASMRGLILLEGGRGYDQEIHSYLSLCNYNGSNPNRDPSKEVIFELVDEEAKAEKESRTRNTLREALNAAADLSAEELKDYTSARGLDDTRPAGVLRNEMEKFALEAPDDFLALIKNKQAVMKAAVNRAIKKGTIIYNEESSRFEWPTKEAILTVARSSSSEAVDELISYFVSSPKGEKVYQLIANKAKK